MSEEKTSGEKLNELLSYQRPNAYEGLDEAALEQCGELSESYKAFLDAGKTERLCAARAKELAVRAGFVPFDPEGPALQCGTRFYQIHRDKAVILGVAGRQGVSAGVNLAVAHIDSPRLDIKPNPLYEDCDMALFKTHYYGGIKKYQWTATPMALHGVVMTRSGQKVEVDIGEGVGDPVFCVTDLLPHLAGEQMDKKMSQGVTGESLNLLVGLHPFADDKVSQKVKLNILNLLYEKYGMIEEDFLCAELEAVPAFLAKDVGLDRSMIGAYGQDDRVCAFAALQAMLDCDAPERTCLCVLADKEEIGSMGTTGIQSRYLENLLADLCHQEGIPLRRVLSCSTCLSADVNAALDPNYQDVSEKNNSSRLGGGVVLTKYTGSRGKSGSSDASAELLGKLRFLFEENGVVWQIGELGKVDQGGGGTVAQFVANLDVETIDCGVAVLSMHAPFEITAKVDLYMTWQAIKAFYEKFHG